MFPITLLVECVDKSLIIKLHNKIAEQIGIDGKTVSNYWNNKTKPKRKNIDKYIIWFSRYNKVPYSFFLLRYFLKEKNEWVAFIEGVKSNDIDNKIFPYFSKIALEIGKLDEVLEVHRNSAVKIRNYINNSVIVEFSEKELNDLDGGMAEADIRITIGALGFKVFFYLLASFEAELYSIIGKENKVSFTHKYLFGSLQYKENFNIELIDCGEYTEKTEHIRSKIDKYEANSTTNEKSLFQKDWIQYWKDINQIESTNELCAIYNEVNELNPRNEEKHIDTVCSGRHKVSPATLEFLSNISENEKDKAELYINYYISRLFSEVIEGIDFAISSGMLAPNLKIELKKLYFDTFNEVIEKIS